MTSVLSLKEARRIAIFAQGLSVSRPPAEISVSSVLTRLGCIQIDSMSAVRRSHELVLLSRGVPITQASRAGTAREAGESFEGMAHALSLLPVEMWPYFSFRRRRVQAYGWRGPAVDQGAVAIARKRLEAQGRVRLADFGGTTGTGWDRSSPYRWALEWLAATGGAVCAERSNWQRIYALPELVIPESLLKQDLSDDDCIEALCGHAVDALGVATIGDIADYFRLHRKQAESGLKAIGAAEVLVKGWDQPAWQSPRIPSMPAIDNDAVNVLSPFDSLVWTRDRLKSLFGKDYRLEAYKPSAKREFGYFGMPLLWGSEVVGRLALRRKENMLMVENSETDPGTPEELVDRAVMLVAEWAQCTTVTAGPDFD